MIYPGVLDYKIEIGGAPDPSSITYDTPGDYVFTVPAGITSIIVECWGGGGGSESIGTNSGTRMVGGAAGGAYARKTISVSPGEEYPLTVGAGGNYVATGTGQGGDTFFNTNVVLAKVVMEVEETPPPAQLEQRQEVLETLFMLGEAAEMGCMASMPGSSQVVVARGLEVLEMVIMVAAL